MKKVRVVPAPRQDDSRVVVLGLILWPHHVALHAVVEADRREIEEPFWEEDQYGMFAMTDDIGTVYQARNGASDHDPELHVRDWTVTLDPAVPDGAKTLTVTHIDGSVEVPL